MRRQAEALRRWADAADRLRWDQRWERVHAPDGRRGRWFVGGRLNVSTNCVDRHLPGRGDRVAVHWEGEPGDRRTLTYAQLHEEVVAVTEALRGLGVAAGERVALHLGWLPETVAVMLACARLGAVHALLPTPLPADALADRLADLRPRVLVTQDAAWRHGVMLPAKARADEALAAAAGVEHTVVVRRTGVDVAWYEGDRWYHELLAGPRPGKPNIGDRPPASVASDHPLLVVYLADRRGHPRGVTHASGGLLTYASAMHRDGIAAGGGDVFWCAADIAWLAGQTHGVYGPLTCGGTAVMFEGMLDTPTRERAWQIVSRYGVTALLTTPSVIRNLRHWTETLAPDRVSTLRRLVTLGEPIEPDTHAWLTTEVGREAAAVADGWGQTELGGVVTLTPPPDRPLPDPGLDIVDSSGLPVPSGERGQLVLRHPWPGMFLGLVGDESDATERYWRRPGMYATEDEARRTTGGHLEILGRTDPVINVSGQLVSATEIQAALLEHPFVVGAEVVDRPDRVTGQAVVACVVLAAEAAPTTRVARELQTHVHDALGGLAQPRAVAFCETLPDDVPSATVRRALWTLCATSTGERLMLSAKQLDAALAASDAAMS